jgi:hypothetical protein
MHLQLIATSIRLVSLIPNSSFEPQGSSGSVDFFSGRAINQSSTSVKRIGQISVGLIFSAHYVRMPLESDVWASKVWVNKNLNLYLSVSPKFDLLQDLYFLLTASSPTFQRGSA